RARASEAKVEEREIGHDGPGEREQAEARVAERAQKVRDCDDSNGNRQQHARQVPAAVSQQPGRDPPALHAQLRRRIANSVRHVPGMSWRSTMSNSTPNARSNASSV